MATEPPPSITDAVDSVVAALDKVDKARALLGLALRAEQAKTGARKPAGASASCP
ncbi:hypothetical protein [Streptomyces sp. HYC2]|uniref:hypothetical protein n=1 Tax=Streptomyces sp. HYC2 TaxID=2955207 RepID=UPI0024811763|nr:hypothetical protein [Streptomyces sp. HYC2]